MTSPHWQEIIESALECLKKEMSLPSSLVPSEKRLVLCQPGSSIKYDSLRNDTNAFGTLILQLSANVRGGELAVYRGDRLAVFDARLMFDPANHLFCAAIYRDCEYEIRPVVTGYGLYLFYNLIVTEAFDAPAEQADAVDAELVELLRNWDGPNKIVYALSKTYARGKLKWSDADLISSDGILLNALKRASDSCDIAVCLASLEKRSDESDDDTYSLRAIVADGRDGELDMEVDFDEEVLPDDCFDACEYYEEPCQCGSGCWPPMRVYKTSAVTLWPKKLTFDTLRLNNARPSLIDELFLTEVKRYFDSECDGRTKSMILRWAKYVAGVRRRDTFTHTAIVNAIFKFQSLELTQELLCSGSSTLFDIFPLIVAQCGKFGWEHFGGPLETLIQKISHADAVKTLHVIFGDDAAICPDKEQLILRGMRAIAQKDDFFQPTYFKYERDDRQKEDAKMSEALLSVVLRHDDLHLMHIFVKHILPLHPETIPLIVTICQRFGWMPFAHPIIVKFKSNGKPKQVLCLTHLLRNGILSDDFESVCRELFHTLFDSSKEFMAGMFDVDKRRKEEVQLLEPLVNASFVFNDLAIMEQIFHRMELHPGTVPILTKLSETFGWKVFADEISRKFKDLFAIDALDTFSLLISAPNFKSQKDLCADLFQTVLGKTKFPPSNSIHRDKCDYAKQQQDTLHLICSVAETLRLSLLAYAKSHSYKFFVPVLVRFISDETNKLSPFWGTVALHFIYELENVTAEPININWKHTTAELARPCCKECLSLLSFLHSDEMSESFKVGKDRRNHLEQRAKLIGRLSCRTEPGAFRKVGVLVITKTEMGGIAETAEQNMWKEQLAKLRSAMPSIV